nr:hypothetical protein [Haladaptatus litoreus]
MYTLGNKFSELEIDPGTNLLISGSPMTGKRNLALDTLAYGGNHGDGAIIVTTKDSGEHALEEYESRLETPSSPVGIVDCVSKQQGMSVRRVDSVEFASSPVDMTGIGIKLSEFLQRFYDSGVRAN